MSEHLGERAALYALGALDSHEQLDVQEHVQHCDACRRLLAQSQADVAAMEAARPRLEPPAELRDRLARSLGHQRPPMLPRAWLAAAAAIAIAFAPAGYLLHQNAAMHETMAADADAMARIASSPHRVAAFNGMDAKVMYATDGSWYCVVIRNARAGLNVVWPHDGTQTMLGTPAAHGTIALLYLPKSHRMDRLTIVQDGRELGQAKLIF